MTNEVIKRNDDYLARYQNDAADGFENFANEGGPGIVGQKISCPQGDWGIGAGTDKVPPPDGALYLVLMPTMTRGWIKWLGNEIADARVHLVSDNIPMPHRYALGDLTEAEWEQDADGKPKDCWRRDYRVQLIAVSAPHDLYTFVGSSHGTRIAFRDLCNEYSRERHRPPDACPIVSLDVGRRQTRYGTHKGPKFPIRGWATIEDVKSGRKAKATTKPTAKTKPSGNTSAELDDQIPDWGCPHDTVAP